MSRLYPRSISGSRSQTSIGTSVASRKSNVVNYHQIANELINGAPLDLVTKRDLRNVLIELSILRSEAQGVKNYILSDQIRDIIVALNKRITPPPMRRTASTTSKNSTVDSSEILSSSKENFESNEKLNSPTHFTPTTIKNLPTDEFNDISAKIDRMLEATDDKSLNQILKQQNYNPETDYPKFNFVIKDRKEKYLKQFRYRELRFLDKLTDKLHPLPYDPKIGYYEDKIEQLENRIELSKCKASTTEATKIIDVNSLKHTKKSQLQKLEEKHQEEMKEFNDNNSIKSQAAINHQSITLKKMRMNERLAAISKDYEGAEKIHRNADILEAEEKNENLLKCEEDRLRNKELLEKKQKAQTDCMEQWYDYLIQKKENDYNKDIDANMAAIEAAKIQISYFEEKRKKLRKPPKHPTD